MAKQVVIMPCSGIGKAFGEIGRQAVYEMVEDLRPDAVTTACLARLMIDDPETKALVQNNYVITLDGCPKECARKNVASAGKTADSALRVIETLREHKELKPQGILELGEPGFQLVHFLAEKLNGEVDCLVKGE